MGGHWRAHHYQRTCHSCRSLEFLAHLIFLGITLINIMAKVDMTPASSVIRVALVDDNLQTHRSVQAILRVVSDIELVAQGANGEEVLQLCEQFHPGIVLMDVVMPVMGGIEATKLLHENHPEIKVLVLSSFQDHESVHTMLRNGAVGYLTKDSLVDDLVDTIRTVSRGKMVFSSSAGAQLGAKPQPATNYHLTDRELETLVLMTKGLSVPEIAAKLVISQSTVKYHIDNICRKLGARARSEALVIAIRNNLV